MGAAGVGRFAEAEADRTARQTRLLAQTVTRQNQGGRANAAAGGDRARAAPPGASRQLDRPPQPPILATKDRILLVAERSMVGAVRRLLHRSGRLQDRQRHPGAPNGGSAAGGRCRTGSAIDSATSATALSRAWAAMNSRWSSKSQTRHRIAPGPACGKWPKGFVRPLFWAITKCASAPALEPPFAPTTPATSRRCCATPTWPCIRPRRKARTISAGFPSELAERIESRQRTRSWTSSGRSTQVTSCGSPTKARFELGTGRPCGCEALLRWTLPNGDCVAPLGVHLGRRADGADQPAWATT